jgi:hypothetical protein
MIEEFDDALTTFSNQFHVTHIMTRESDYCTERDDPSTVLETMQQQNYDIMPIQRNAKFIGYVERNSLDKTTPVERVLQQINLDVVVSANTYIHEMIRLFQRSKFFFINRANDLIGLVTYADLNKIPVRVWIYILINKLEYVLLQLIKSYYPDSSWMNELTDDRQKKITDRFNDKKKEDVETSLEDCLNLSDMIDLVERDRKLRSLMGFTSKKTSKKQFSGLNTLRNRTMHPSTSLITNYDSVKTLNQRIERLQHATTLVKRLNDRLAS